MMTPKTIADTSETQSRPTPLFPTNSAEFVNTISHYYRGEMSRMISWRDRLDRTTNWAIAGGAAMLSVSLSTPLARGDLRVASAARVFGGMTLLATTRVCAGLKKLDLRLW